MRDFKGFCVSRGASGWLVEGSGGRSCEARRGRVEGVEELPGLATSRSALEGARAPRRASQGVSDALEGGSRGAMVSRTHLEGLLRTRAVGRGTPLAVLSSRVRFTLGASPGIEGRAG